MNIHPYQFRMNPALAILSFGGRPVFRLTSDSYIIFTNDIWKYPEAPITFAVVL